MRNCVQENSLLVQEQQASLLSKDHPIYGKLVLEDGTAFDGISFGYARPIAGEVVFGTDIPYYDPDGDNLVAQVSTRRVLQEGSGDTTIVLLDCGAKRNIARSLLARNVRVMTVPWDFDLFAPSVNFAFDGVVVSN